MTSPHFRWPTGTYLLQSERCAVRFRTRHLFGLAAVQGAFTIARGRVDIVEPVAESTAVVEIDAASFATGHPRRDRDVRGRRFLDAEENPLIVVRIDAVEEQGPGKALGTGTLEVSSRSTVIQVSVDDVHTDGTELQAHATARVDRVAAGIITARGMAGRHLDFDLHLVATRP